MSGSSRIPTALRRSRSARWNRPVRPTLRGESTTRSESCTVYFDGACPVCRREIAHYRRQRGSESMAWIDASSCDEAELGPGLDRSVVLSRFHVRNADGTLASGAAAFVAIWRRLPAFAWLAALASSRPVLALLEAGYSIFLRVRPWWRPIEVPINAAPKNLSVGGADRTAGQAEPPARSVVRVASAPEESR
ncbi:MAG: DUF393 domain-containing protein [Burkholderiales bacterium]